MFDCRLLNWYRCGGVTLNIRYGKYVLKDIVHKSMNGWLIGGVTWESHSMGYGQDGAAKMGNINTDTSDIAFVFRPGKQLPFRTSDVQRAECIGD